MRRLAPAVLTLSLVVGIARAEDVTLAPCGLRLTQPAGWITQEIDEDTTQLGPEDGHFAVYAWAHRAADWADLDLATDGLAKELDKMLDDPPSIDRTKARRFEVGELKCQLVSGAAMYEHEAVRWAAVVVLGGRAPEVFLAFADAADWNEQHERDLEAFVRTAHKAS